MPETAVSRRWGTSPWDIAFRPAHRPIPDEINFAVIGGGFTGLAAAAWLRQIAPEKSVAVFESGIIGSGASGNSGGMALEETSVGDLPGLGDVLGGFIETTQALGIECDLALTGAWEIGRTKPLANSMIAWNDSGKLRVTKNIPGGAVDPGKLVSGLARAAERLGAKLFENTRIEKAVFGESLSVQTLGRTIRADQILFATNAASLELSGLAARAHAKFTLAVATEPLAEDKLEALGLVSRRPFYTVDFPYLWGRLLPSDGVVFGAGLVHCNDWRELDALDISLGESAELINRLEHRVRGLIPEMHSVEFTHRWGGPILIAEDWKPIFIRHPESPRALVLGGYAGQGVTLSVYLGRWAAEAMLGRRELPLWR